MRINRRNTVWLYLVIYEYDVMSMTEVSRPQYFSRANIIQSGASYIVKLQMIYLLTQLTSSIMHDPSVIAEPLVSINLVGVRLS